MKYSQFRLLTFKSKEDLSDWLNKTAFRIINLKGYGQDMLTIWAHDTGEILHCDFHSQIYTGKFIDMKKLCTGNHLNIWDDRKNRYVIYENLFVESLTTPTPTP